MPKMRTLRVVDSSYLDTAPVRDHLVQAIPASADSTFRCLEDGDAWSEWLKPVQGVTWTSPKPFGVGTTRTVVTKPGGDLEEEFFAWEDGRRMAFYFVRSGLPFFKAFAEDYVVTPVGEDRCELRWSWAFEAPSILQPVLAFGFKKNCVGSLKNLADYMRDNADKYQ